MTESIHLLGQSLTRRRLIAGISAIGCAAVSAACGSTAPPPDQVELAAPPNDVSTPTQVPRPTATPHPSPTLPPIAPTLTPLPPIVTAPPIRLKIPRIQIDAPIIPVGILSDGSMEAPTGPVNIGWYRGSPRPGEPGNALLTGHVDWHTSLGVFWHLKEVQIGDTIAVEDSAGQQHAYHVEHTTSYDKNNAPVEQILGYAIGIVATLITCDGIFDNGVHDYNRRLIVRARLL